MISDDNVFQGVKSKVVKYLGIDADSSDIDLNGLCCLAAGWYFSHLYGILPPGATLAVKMSFAARKGFSLTTVIGFLVHVTCINNSIINYVLVSTVMKNLP